MEQLVLQKGDYGYEIEFTIKTHTGSAEDLSLDTCTMKVWSPLVPGTIVVSGTCAKSTSETGVCSYTVGSTDFTSAEEYLVKVERTRTGVKKSTFPIPLIIKENG